MLLAEKSRAGVLATLGSLLSSSRCFDLSWREIQDVNYY